MGSCGMLGAEELLPNTRAGQLEVDLYGSFYIYPSQESCFSIVVIYIVNSSSHLVNKNQRY